ncbi:lamin tail domain-containing protein [Vibrio gazogenes]|uniref:Lamin Tail Domain n=1 Tax=Vibrio gazogenes DSM 21264 = NBRC 103151 TaxID=1123492 RepID=A0A1M5HIU6_VIBGA|nr:lamin tail domain-containing protein [Vibrio gazogenes]USP13257.1 lamin tail domain-containing protein [Vibrio gazogenes]SHG15732.1 Lamin Tail Domain [Vibrio gazogenes DSM 21264] [Vibrio gazogenes DSM 21264 = NBRC 103151]SJN56698.1 Intermediate filament tail domain protein [Vibrio gazogenes]
MSNTTLKIHPLCQEILSTDPLENAKMDEFWDKLNDLQMKLYLQISGLDFRGEPNNNESVTITNRSHAIWDISQFRINAGSLSQNYVFPENTLIRSGESITVYTQPGAQYSFNSNRPVWNNHGDTATLLNSKGDVISTWIYGNAARDYVLISYLHYDGHESRTEGDEYVELKNLSEYYIDLAGWQLRSELNDHTFTFPSGSTFAPLGTVLVYTNRLPTADNEYSFNNPTALWNNTGGRCTLLDYDDNEVAFYAY